MKGVLLLIIVILLIVLVAAVVLPGLTFYKDGSVRYYNHEVYKPDPTPVNVVNKLVGK